MLLSFFDLIFGIARLVFLIRYFRLYGEFISFARTKETEPKKMRPGPQALIKSDESSIVTPDLCGCCGTHESKSMIRSDILAESPT